MKTARHYEVTVEIDSANVPSMRHLADTIADTLQRTYDLSEQDYDLLVKGPPELRIGVVMR